MLRASAMCAPSQCFQQSSPSVPPLQGKNLVKFQPGVSRYFGSCRLVLGTASCHSACFAASQSIDRGQALRAHTIKVNTYQAPQSALPARCSTRASATRASATRRSTCHSLPPSLSFVYSLNSQRVTGTARCLSARQVLGQRRCRKLTSLDGEGRRNPSLMLCTL